LKLENDEMLSNFDFSFHLRRYDLGWGSWQQMLGKAEIKTPGSVT